MDLQSQPKLVETNELYVKNTCPAIKLLPVPKDLYFIEEHMVLNSCDLVPTASSIAMGGSQN